LSDEEGDKALEKASSSKKDPVLWKSVQQLAEGSVEDRVHAIETIFLRQHELPATSTKLAQRLAQKDQPKEVRLAVANNLVKNKHIPTGMYFDLLKSLSADPDKGIQKAIAKIFQEDFQFQKQVSEFRSSFMKITQELSKKQQKLFGQNLSTIPGKLILPMFTIPNILGEQAAKTARVHTSGFYPEIELDTLTTKPEIPPKSKAQELVERLKNCQPGQVHWREYEDVCKEILSYCLEPPLLPPEEQSVTADGLHKRDLIFHIPMDNLPGFWHYILTVYGRAVIVDCKNYSHELKENEIVIASKYLGKKKLTKLGLLVTRAGLSEGGKKGQKERWEQEDKLLICLNDQDLIKMLELKEKEDEPWKVIDKGIVDFLKSL
jgi:hypothetical protein